MGKPWYLSKTNWVAILTTLSGLVGVIGGQEWIASHPGLVAGLAIVTGVINVILRSLTSEPVTLGV